MKVIYITFILGFLLISCQAKKQKFSLSQIINHYNKIQLPASYILEYREEHFIPYQSYDYKNPNGLTAVYLTEVDSKKKYLYNKSTTNVGGGFTFDYITMIKDTAAFEYSENRLWKGNRIDDVDAKENYNYYKRVSLNQISIHKAKTFLQTPIDSLDYKWDSITGEVIITKINKNDTLTYVFLGQPIRLKKIIQNDDTYILEDFKQNKDFAYATQYSLYTNDELKKRVMISSFDVTESISTDKLLLPKNYTFDKPKFTKKVVSKIGKYTYIIRDEKYNRNILFTNVNNAIMVIGAPSSSKFSKKVLDIIKKELPNGKVLFVYVTHLHSDHIMGLEAYAKRGITIVADQYTIEGIKAFKPFEQTIKNFHFKVIKDREIVNGVQFHYPPNRHCKSQGFAYSMTDKIIYQGDFMQVSPSLVAPTIMPETTKSFIERIHKDKLDVNTIVSHHQAGNEVPIRFLNNYYKMTTK